jgi:hypothetical protein
MGVANDCHDRNIIVACSRKPCSLMVNLSCKSKILGSTIAVEVTAVWITDEGING